MQAAFNRFMEAHSVNLPPWLDSINFKSEFGGQQDTNGVVFVDIGGGNGQQCALLLKRFPEFKDRVVLQDLPDVLEKAVAVDGMKATAYDFMTEQPVKGE